MEDNLYVNDSSNVWTPFEKKEEDDSEISQAKEHFDLLEDLVLYLDKQIDHYSSIDAIPDETLKSPEDFMHSVEARKIVKEVLTTERAYIAQLLGVAKD